MIISWNIRGLSSAAKQKEISSRLFKLQPMIAILLETRIKKDNAEKNRNKMDGNRLVYDNYRNHVNGRIWFTWQGSQFKVKLIATTEQLIHCGVYNSDDN